MRKGILGIGTAGFLLVAGPALACGGLVAPNGGVRLVRTSTLAAYVDGVEHYVTSFEFSGARGQFGSIVPLPGVPTSVRRGGDWTLQRLQIEVQPPAPAALRAESAGVAAADVEILEQKKVGALDITVLRGGGEEVSAWARENGFDLSPDAPEVLTFYAERSPVFMAAKFDAERAARRGLTVGDGTPIHLTIPTDDPWVPLRILALGKPGSEVVEADVFLLTELEPAILPAAVPAGLADRVEHPGLILERRERASAGLLADLRSDRGMRWLPEEGMWLTYLRVDEEAGDLRYDLAVDASGARAPDPVAAGLAARPSAAPAPDLTALWVFLGLLGALAALALAERSRARWTG